MYPFNHSFTSHLMFRYQMGSFSFYQFFQKACQSTIFSKFVWSFLLEIINSGSKSQRQCCWDCITSLSHLFFKVLIHRRYSNLFYMSSQWQHYKKLYSSSNRIARDAKHWRLDFLGNSSHGRKDKNDIMAHKWIIRLLRVDP